MSLVIRCAAPLALLLLNAEGKSLPEIAEALRTFLVPVSEAVAREEILKRNWKPRGPWVVLAR